MTAAWEATAKLGKLRCDADDVFDNATKDNLHQLTHVSRGGASRLATAGGESECLGEAVESPSPPCGRLSGLRETLNVS